MAPARSLGISGRFIAYSWKFAGSVHRWNQYTRLKLKFYWALASEPPPHPQKRMSTKFPCGNVVLYHSYCSCISIRHWSDIAKFKRMQSCWIEILMVSTETFAKVAVWEQTLDKGMQTFSYPNKGQNFRLDLNQWKWYDILLEQKISSEVFSNKNHMSWYFYNLKVWFCVSVKNKHPDKGSNKSHFDS